MNTSLAKSIVTTEVSKTRVAFILVISLSFQDAFSNNLSPILIPHLKKTFTLTMTQSTFVDSVAYLAYFLISRPADYVEKVGHKVGIVTGLIVFSLDTFLFIPAKFDGYKLIDFN